MGARNGHRGTRTWPGSPPNLRFVRQVEGFRDGPAPRAGYKTFGTLPREGCPLRTPTIGKDGNQRLAATGVT